jgi:hypothetical protein
MGDHRSRGHVALWQGDFPMVRLRIGLGVVDRPSATEVEETPRYIHIFQYLVERVSRRWPAPGGLAHALPAPKNDTFHIYLRR